jgi:hypothetical protein
VAETSAEFMRGAGFPGKPRERDALARGTLLY